MMPEIKLDPIKPEKALEYWKTKRPLSQKEKEALEKGSRERALAVTGLSRQKQLAQVYGALEKALAEGTTLADFKKDIKELREKESWPSWRLETIFRANLQSAYAAGAWAEIQATKEAFPYLQYVAVGDKRTRPSHAVMNGLVYPVDDPFWQHNYPPNGFNCRCATVPVSAHRLKKEGLNVQEGPPGPMTYNGPGGYPIHVAAPGADRGFTDNIGRDWLSGLSPSELSEALSFGPARMVCPVSGEFAGEDGPCGLPLNKIAARHIPPVEPGDILPAGKSEEYYAREFLKAFGIKSLEESKLIRLPGVDLPLVISKALLVDKTTGQLKSNKYGRGPYMKLLAATLQNPYEIWRVPGNISGKPYQVLRLLRLFQAEGQKIGGFGVFNLVLGKGWKGATVFTPKIGDVEELMFKYLEKQRQGHLLYREP